MITQNELFSKRQRLLKVFLDDIREAPNGWIRTRTAQETIDLLKHHSVRSLSLDHDLGREETGYDVLKWLEEAVIMKEIDHIPDVILIHSANPVGRARMEQAIRSILRRRKECLTIPKTHPLS